MWFLYRLILLAPVFVLVMLLSCCGHPKTANREDLKRAAAEVVSIAAEGQLFIDFVEQGHATSNYARAHPNYLKLLADASAQQLHNMEAGPEVQAALLEQLRFQTDRLNDAVDKLGGSLQDPGALAVVHTEFSNIARLAGQIGQML